MLPLSRLTLWYAWQPFHRLMPRHVTFIDAEQRPDHAVETGGVVRFLGSLR